MKSRGSLLFIVLGLLFILSACGTPPQPESEADTLWTKARFGAYTQQLAKNANLTVQGQENEALAALAAVPRGAPIENLSALANPSSLGDSSAAASLLQSFSVAGLAHFSELAPANNSGAIPLPRGVFKFDGSNWVPEGPSDNLVLKFPFTNFNGATSQVTIDMDWDKHKPTTQVTDGVLRYEVPQKMRLRSYTDGNKSGFIDIEAEWYKSLCGTTLLEPRELELEGEFGFNGVIGVEFEIEVKKTHKDEKNLGAAYFGNNTAIESDGFVKVTVGKDSGKVFWNNIAYATITRGKNCMIATFKLDRGDIDFGASFTISGKTTTAQLRFEFSNIVLANNASSVDLDGKIKVDGQVVVLFEGTLDATGQRLELTFADGTMTLAEFVKKFLGNIPVDLGNVPLPSLP